MIRFCRKNCKELSPKEKDQTRRKESHQCSRFGMQIFHGPFHPNLIMGGECIRDREG